jgi:hypothetical protein
MIEALNKRLAQSPHHAIDVSGLTQHNRTTTEPGACHPRAQHAFVAVAHVDRSLHRHI